MAWTNPRTWVAAETVTAAEMNAHVRDNLSYLKDNPTLDTGVTAPAVTATGTVQGATVHSTGNVTATADITGATVTTTATVNAGNYLRAGTAAVPVTNVDIGLVLSNAAGGPPVESPVGGGWLYVQAGALKFKGSSGTVTTIAVAQMATSAAIWPSGSVVDSATLTTSLFDFDSSLPKYMKAVMVDADIPLGSRIDISYFTNKIPYDTLTPLQTGVSPGVEYTIGTQARSIGFVITLFVGLFSSNGPTLKRVYVRAAPMQQTFRQCEYSINLTGKDGEQMLKLRNDQTHHLDGLEMATNLNTALTSSSPITVTDRFGTYTGVIEPSSTEMREISPEEFVAHVSVRQV